MYYYWQSIIENNFPYLSLRVTVCVSLVSDDTVCESVFSISVILIAVRVSEPSYMAVDQACP
jgi:hypothetical protein